MPRTATPHRHSAGQAISQSITQSAESRCHPRPHSCECGYEFWLQRADAADASPVVEQRFGAVDAAAEAGFADAAVGDAVREHVVGVDPGVAGFHLFGDAGAAVEVGRPDAVGEAVVGAVHHLEGFVFAFEFGQVGDGAEDFLAGGDVFERAFHEGGLNVMAVLAGDFGGSAFDDHFGAFFHAFVEIGENALALLLVDDGTHLRAVLHLIADFDFLQALRALVDELLVDAAMDEPAGGVAADLAGVERDRADEFRGGVGNVDIFEDDGGAFAA